MPLDNGKVMVPWPLAEELLTLRLTAPTLRLAIAMLHQLDLAGCCGPSGPEECPIIWADSQTLRERVGPTKSKSGREVRATAMALLETGVLEQAAVLDKATKLQWQFNATIWHYMRDRDWSNFVLVDLEELGLFRSPYRISLYLIARKVRGSNAPEFIVRYDETISEEANIRRLRSALQLVSATLDVVCYAALEMRSDVPAPEHFKVRMTHPETLWRHHGYMKFKRPKAIWKVDQSGSRAFDPRLVRDERADQIGNDDQGLDQQTDWPL